MTTHELHIGQRVIFIDEPTSTGTIIDVKRTHVGPQFIVDFDGATGLAARGVGVYGKDLVLVNA